MGVKTDNKGRVLVDDHFKTNVDGIYAIGDVIPGPMLAHKAEVRGLLSQQASITFNRCAVSDVRAAPRARYDRRRTAWRAWS